MSQKIVVLGGGTGQFNLLTGLIKFNDPELITAIPGTWDSGGSSGRLRTEQGVLPPGDARQCLIALMEDPKQREVAIAAFNDRSINDHSLGNLIIAVLEKVYHGQDRGLDRARELFRVRGKVTPTTLNELELTARLQSGKEIQGEVNIDHSWARENYNPEDKIVRIYFNTHTQPNPEAIKALKDADKIVFSSGSLFGSILPHLIVDGIQEAIRSSKAKLIFVMNLMTERGQTEHYKASDHLAALAYYLEDPNRLDYLIVNNKTIEPEILKIYAAEDQTPVVVDAEECIKIAPKIRIIRAPLASYSKKAHLLRHDSEKLAETIVKLP